jgi:biotin-dependent carboxylase-like uncharacterized protein
VTAKLQGSTIEVVRPGPLATVQDLGRPGLAALGVGASGAADRRAVRLANRLVGNPEGAAAIEATLGGLTLRFEALALIALAGAPCDAWLAGGTALAMHAPEYVPAGAELRLGMPESGLRTYVAVAGGIDVAPVLGSRSTDTLAGLGPEQLRAGRRLPVGPARGAAPGVDAAPVAPLADMPVLRVRLGPRDDWFTPAALATLKEERWTVSADANRVGIRLDGPALERREPTLELPSEGMVEGAVQVPPSGRPVLFLADHPVTGGYPVIAVVAAEDLPAAAQARPGASLRFKYST